MITDFGHSCFTVRAFTEFLPYPLCFLNSRFSASCRKLSSYGIIMPAELYIFNTYRSFCIDTTSVLPESSAEEKRK
jgi:hypothetical protein